MDMRTGQTYDSREAALSAGVPAADIAHIVNADAVRRDTAIPEVRFSAGPFKKRVYKRVESTGQLVRVR